MRAMRRLAIPDAAVRDRFRSCARLPARSSKRHARRVICRGRIVGTRKLPHRDEIAKPSADGRPACAAFATAVPRVARPRFRDSGGDPRDDV
jgi:hypothetical protein